MDLANSVCIWYRDKGDNTEFQRDKGDTIKGDTIDGLTNLIKAKIL